MTGELCGQLSFLQKMKKIIDDSINNIHTCLPAIVTDYNPRGNVARVQPIAQYTDRSGIRHDFPEIMDVPVVMPSFVGGSIIIPVGVGDECLLIFAEQSLEYWLDEGKYIPMADMEKYALSNAIALVGYTTKSADAVAEAREKSCADKKIRIIGKVDVSGELSVNGKAVQVDE